MISSISKPVALMRCHSAVTRATNLAATRRPGHRLLTTKTPQKPPALSNKVEPPAATGTRPNPNSTNANPNEMSNPPDVEMEITPQMKMANYVLATVLVGFVGGVWYYSMSSVGSQEQDSDDPLAQLKLEAQEAMDRQKKDNTPDERAQQLLQEFNRGDHDPDKAEVDALEELDAEEEAGKKKKPWWKFW